MMTLNIRAGLLRGAMMSTNDMAAMSAATINKLLEDGELLHAEDAAAILDYTPMGVYQLSNRKLVKSIKVGHTRLYYRTEIENWKRRQAGRKRRARA